MVCKCLVFGGMILIAVWQGIRAWKTRHEPLEDWVDKEGW